MDTLAPAEPRTGDFLSFAQREFHRVAYTDWGDISSRRVVICVHGLSRQGRDFDFLAAELARRGYRVICPDLVGRGHSGRLKNPDHYALPQYAVDMAMMIAHLGVKRLDWIGTSLGGLIGMVLAAARGTPIQRIVINDIGPSLPWAALRRIGKALREAPSHHPNLAVAEDYLRRVHAPFGQLTASQWQHLTRNSFAPDPAGGWRTHFDPGIAEAFRPGRIYNVSLWRYWDALQCPVLLLRGVESDRLTPEAANEMIRRAPRVDYVEIPGCGHAPALLDETQIGLVAGWIDRPL